MKSAELRHLVLVLVLMHVRCGLGLTTESKTTRDVAITRVAIPDSCTQGDIVPVAVSVANKGNYRETFRVALTDTKTGKEIAGKEVTLAKDWKKGSGAISGGYRIFHDDTDEQSNLGFSLCATGDENKDGVSDILIGDAYINNFTGKVSLFYGGKNIETSSPDMIFSGENTGPIGFQGYGIGGDAHENLKRTMNAWRELNEAKR